MRTSIMLSIAALIAISFQIAPSNALAHEQGDEFLNENAATASVLALGMANAVVGTMLVDGEMPPALLAEDGCYVWQQPGVALTITDLWMPAGDAPELWLSDEKLLAFLQAQAGLSWNEPLRNPGEPLESDMFYLPPTVYLLDINTAQLRLNWHIERYHTWIRYNEGIDFIDTSPECQLVDYAVVFIDSTGPLEFYFTKDEVGILRLTHLIFYDFFSA